MIDTVLVDMGETLVSFKPKYHQNVAFLLKNLGYEVDEKKVFRAVYKVLGGHHYPHPQIWGLSQPDFRDIFLELGLYPEANLIEKLNNSHLLSGEWELFDDSIYFLENMKEMGKKLVLVTNSTDSVYRIIRDTGIAQYFDAIVSSYELGVMKPHPKIFNHAMKSVNGRNGVHIGDIYEIDYVGARRSFITPILLDRDNFYDDLMCTKAKDLKEVISIVEKMDQKDK